MKLDPSSTLYRQVAQRYKARVAQCKVMSVLRVEKQLGWCPREYREQYRTLKATKRLSAPEARQAIEALMAKDGTARC